MLAISEIFASLQPLKHRAEYLRLDEIAEHLRSILSDQNSSPVSRIAFIKVP